jgi:drug/metabolite transporter (DMT)-like permease
VLVLEVPPLRAAAVRFSLAAIVLMAIALARRGKVPVTAKHWRAAIILGFTMMAVPYGLLFWAEYRISSSMTAVLYSSCPLFVALFTPLMTKSHVPRQAVFAMLIAMGGIAALFYTELSSSPSLLAGGAAIMVAVLISSWSSVFAKRELNGLDPLVGTAIQFAVSSAVLFLGSVTLEKNIPSHWSASSIGALLFLALFGSVIAFSLYYWLLGSMHAYQLSTTNLIVPLVAMAEGGLLLREAVSLWMLLAAVLVLVAVVAVLKAQAEEEIPIALALHTSAVKLRIPE